MKNYLTSAMALIFALTMSQSGYASLDDSNSGLSRRQLAASHVYSMMLQSGSVKEMEQALRESGFSKAEVLGSAIQTGQITAEDLSALEGEEVAGLGIIALCTLIIAVGVCTVRPPSGKDSLFK